jgi:hypothetical protein
MHYQGVSMRELDNFIHNHGGVQRLFDFLEILNDRHERKYIRLGNLFRVSSGRIAQWRMKFFDIHIAFKPEVFECLKQYHQEQLYLAEKLQEKTNAQHQTLKLILGRSNHPSAIIITPTGKR